jgi:hypothetical protein
MFLQALAQARPLSSQEIEIGKSAECANSKTSKGRGTQMVPNIKIPIHSERRHEYT